MLNQLDLDINGCFLVDEILDTLIIYKKDGNLIEMGPCGKRLTRKAENRGFSCWKLRKNGWVYDSPVEERQYKTKNGIPWVMDKKFDVVSCLDILDRVPNPLEEMKSINKLLKDDGILLLRVPNFGSTIAEGKGIEWQYNKPWERIYQFDYLRLKDLLDKSGFRIIHVKTELSDGVGAPGCMIIIGMKKSWRIKKNKRRILVIREGAAGDVLLATPIVKELKKQLPDSYLAFKTKYPEILQNNPYVDEIIRFEPKGNVDVVFDLMYELYPDIPIIEAYEKIAHLSLECPEIEFYLSSDEQAEIDVYMQRLSIGNAKGLAVIHPMVGNRIKSWNKDRYQEVANYISSKKLHVLTVGSPLDCMELDEVINLIGRLSLRQSAAVISRARLFVGLDSFPMHIANAFKIPSVILFGSTDPHKVLIDGRKVKIVRSLEHCLGCRHDTTPDRWKENVDCRRERLYCMENIVPVQVTEQIEEMLKQIG
jgi:ADP-heptose:LPS heptosyltransferase